MIELTRGDLLRSDAEAWVNTVNTKGVAGKGLALQFRREVPENYVAYAAAARRGEVVPGRMFVFDTGRDGPGRWVVNFPTKRHWKERTRLGDVREGLDDLVRVIRELGIRSIAVPPLGCGLGGRDWVREVEPLVRAALEPLEDVRVLLYEP